MTLSKKILTASFFAFSMYNGAQPQATDVAYEVSHMLNFAQTLRRVKHKESLKVAQWLEEQACDTSYQVQDYDIMSIANIIDNPNLTLQSKVSALSQTMKIHKKRALNITINKTITGFCGAFGVFAFFGTMIYAMVEEIKNPTPKPIEIIVYGKHPYYRYNREPLLNKPCPVHGW